MNEVLAEQLRPAYSRVALFRGQAGITVDDVLAFGWFLGELTAPWRELLAAVACEECAAESDLEADNESLTSMLEEFRYERELLTVEETERWLAARDLTEDDLSDYLVRRYWRENPPGSARAEDLNYLESSPELREMLRAELLFSGKFDRLTRSIGWRLAGLADQGEVEASPEILSDERARFFGRTELDVASLPEALQQLNRKPEWLEECLRMEVSYRRTCDALLTNEARARTLAVMRLPLTRVIIESLTLRSGNAAQEAVLCLTEKRLTTAELAKECGSCWEREELFLQDCETSLQQELLSAAPGEVLAPKQGEQGFLVTRIDAKKDPELKNNEVRARIDRHLLKSHFSELASRNIRWVLGEP